MKRMIWTQSTDNCTFVKVVSGRFFRYAARWETPEGPTADPSGKMDGPSWPHQLDQKDDLPFVKNLIPGETDEFAAQARDVPSELNFWVVHQVGAYEHAPTADNDPDIPDEEIAWLGWSFKRNGDGPNVVYYETTRDVREDTTGAVELDLLERRVSAHEALHRFLGWHGTEVGAADQGIMDYTTALTGNATANQLTAWQIHVIQRITYPK